MRAKLIKESITDKKYTYDYEEIGQGVLDKWAVEYMSEKN